MSASLEIVAQAPLRAMKQLVEIEWANTYRTDLRQKGDGHRPCSHLRNLSQFHRYQNRQHEPDLEDDQ